MVEGMKFVFSTRPTDKQVAEMATAENRKNCGNSSLGGHLGHWHLPGLMPTAVVPVATLMVNFEPRHSANLLSNSMAPVPVQKLTSRVRQVSQKVG